MKKRLIVAVLGSVAAAAVLTVFRILTLPQVQETVGGTYPPLWALATVVVLAGVCLCGMRRYDDTVAMRPACVRAVGAGSVAAGSLLVVSCLAPWKDWMDAQVLPFPVNDTVTAADPVLFYLLTAFGVLGGAVLLWFGISTLTNRVRLHKVMRCLILFPLLWSWVRILRYELSHISTLQIAKHWPDVLLLIAQALFLLTFAKTVALPAQKPSRFAAGIALCAGVCGLVGSILRGYLALTAAEQTQTIAGLVTAADLGIAVLAFAVAFALLSAEAVERPATEPLVEQPEPGPAQTERPEPADDEDEEDGSNEPILLLTDEAFLSTPDDDEAIDPDDEADGPLELEDVIDDILKRLSDGEK